MPTGGAAPYAFSWSNETTNQNLTNVGQGNYNVTITDANGCSEFFDQLTVENDCKPSIIQVTNPAISSQVFQVAQFIQ